MAKLPPWLLGRHSQTIQIYPVTVDGSGNMSTGSVSSLVGQLDNISMVTTPDLENIQAMDIRRKNNVIVEDDFQLVFTEILKRNNTNVLVTMAAGYDYFYIIVTRGTDQWAAYVTRGEYAEDLQKGKSTGRLTTHMCDPGQVNPAFTPGFTSPPPA